MKSEEILIIKIIISVIWGLFSARQNFSVTITLRQFYTFVFIFEWQRLKGFTRKVCVIKESSHNDFVLQNITISLGSEKLRRIRQKFRNIGFTLTRQSSVLPRIWNRSFNPSAWAALRDWSPKVNIKLIYSYWLLLTPKVVQ